MVWYNSPSWDQRSHSCPLGVDWMSDLIGDTVFINCMSPVCWLGHDLSTSVELPWMAVAASGLTTLKVTFWHIFDKFYGTVYRCCSLGSSCTSVCSLITARWYEYKVVRNAGSLGLKTVIWKEEAKHHVDTQSLISFSDHCVTSTCPLLLSWS